MQVPTGLLIVLVCLTSIFIFITILISVLAFKHWLRTRKYNKLRASNEKCFRGKVEAYFGAYEESYGILPLTQPTIIQQSRTQLIAPTFKTQSVPNSICSYSTLNRGTFERRYPQNNLGRCFSMDERVFRRSFQQRAGLDKTMDSPPTIPSYIGSVESRTSSRNSVTEPLSVYSVDNTPDRYMNAATFISQEMSVNEGSMATEPVVSYDQEVHSNEKSFFPGMLCFMLQYNSHPPELLITVKHAVQLPSATGSLEGQVNSYVNLCIVPEDFLWKRTRVVENDRDPVFNETFQIRDVLHHKLREYTICLYVMDSHPILGERVVGKVLYPLADLRAEQLVDVCKELS